jgi:hypothetical protein
MIETGNKTATLALRRYSRRMRIAAASTALCCLFPVLVCAEPPPRMVVRSDTVVDAAALFLPDGLWGRTLNGRAFQQEALLSHGGWQYATYFDADRRVCLARRKSGATEWDVIRFEDHRFKGRDTHNAAVVGICPRDGTIHVSFDHHGHPLRYRVSEKGLANEPDGKPFTAEQFGAIRDWLEEGKRLKRVTYPRFFATPGGGLQMAYRLGGSGDGDTHLADYDPQAGTWRDGGAVIGRGGTLAGDASRCAYENAFTYDAKGTLHVTWCWRETGAPETNHDLCYAWSADGGKTWANGVGAVVGERGKRLVTLDTPGVRAVEVATNRGLINSVSQAVDRAGRVHAMTFHLPDGTRTPATWKESRSASRYQHYWRDADGKWFRNELPLGGGAGSRPQLAINEAGDAWLVFAFEGRLCLAAATAAKKWTDWEIVHRGDFDVVGEPRFDPTRWQVDGVLSVYVQEMPEEEKANASALRVIEFR